MRPWLGLLPYFTRSHQPFYFSSANVTKNYKMDISTKIKNYRTHGHSTQVINIHEKIEVTDFPWHFQTIFYKMDISTKIKYFKLQNFLMDIHMFLHKILAVQAAFLFITKKSCANHLHNIWAKPFLCE